MGRLSWLGLATNRRVGGVAFWNVDDGNMPFGPYATASEVEHAAHKSIAAWGRLVKVEKVEVVDLDNATPSTTCRSSLQRQPMAPDRKIAIVAPPAVCALHGARARHASRDR